MHPEQRVARAPWSLNSQATCSEKLPYWPPVWIGLKFGYILFNLWWVPLLFRKNRPMITPWFDGVEIALTIL